MDFGQHLIKLRKDRAIGRRKLAELTGLSLSYLHEVETSEYLPGHENLRKIAKALDIDEDGLLAERDRIEYERMGLDPDATVQLKEMGDLSERERERLVRLIQKLKRERSSN